MPTYDLKCNKCGHKFIDIHKMSEPHSKCPECGSIASVDFSEGLPNFQFKGDGWASKEIKEDRRLEQAL